MLHSASIEQELLEQAHSGDVVALNALLQNTRPMLRSRAAASIPPGLRTRIDPSDLTQETLADAQKQLPTLRNLSAVAFRAWLVAILRNNLKEQLRHEGRSKRDSKRLLSESTPLATVASRETTPSTMAARIDTASLLRRLVDRLTTEQKAAVWLRYRDNLSHQEIADRLGKTVPAVEAMLWRATKTLRNLLPGDEAPT